MKPSCLSAPPSSSSSPSPLRPDATETAQQNEAVTSAVRLSLYPRIDVHPAEPHLRVVTSDLALEEERAVGPPPAEVSDAVLHLTHPPAQHTSEKEVPGTKAASIRPP